MPSTITPTTIHRQGRADPFLYTTAEGLRRATKGGAGTSMGGPVEASSAFDLRYLLKQHLTLVFRPSVSRHEPSASLGLLAPPEGVLLPPLA